MSRRNDQIKMRVALFAGVLVCSVTTAVSSGWTGDVPTAYPEVQSTTPGSGNSSEIQSHGGLRDPIGPHAAPRPEGAGGASDGIQERGLSTGAIGNLTDKTFQRRPAPQPFGNPPPNLCHAETRMLTQCKCFSQTECQALTALFPNSCAAGSSHCEFTPMSRGAMPPLPPNLCGYQVPLTVTKCECHSQEECQRLSPFCSGSCPPGSHSCECTPMQRR